MYELVVLACLVGPAPAVCAERLLPSADAPTQADCEATAEARMATWEEAHPGLTLSGPRCAPRFETGPTLSLEQVTPGVYVHAGGIGIPSPETGADLANLGVIIGDESIAVIDAGGSRAVGEAFYRAIRAVSDKPIKAAILTHMHPDHVLGAAVFAELGTEVIGHPKLDRALRSRAENYQASLSDLLGADAFIGTRAVFPTVNAEDGMEIDLGNRRLRLRIWPTAHTDNDLTVFDIETATLFAGDLVFQAHTPALDGSLLGWRAVLDELGETAARVIPGHGGPVLDWPAGGEPLRHYLDVLTEETRAAIRKGESLGEATRHIAQGEAGKWRLFNEFNIRNATAAYKELEWE